LVNLMGGPEPATTLLQLTAGGIAFALGAGILLYERFSAASRHFFAVAGSVAVWFVALAVGDASPVPETADRWWRVAAAFQALTAAAVYALAVHLTKAPRRTGWVRAAWAGGIAWAVWALLADPVVRGLGALSVRDLGSPIVMVGIGLVGYVAATILAALGELLAGYRRARAAIDRRRHLAMLLAMGVGALAVAEYFFPAPLLGLAPVSTVAITLALVLIGVAQIRYWTFAEDAGFSTGQILRALGDAVLVCDELGRIRITNPEARRLIGGGPADIVGRPLADFLLPADESAPGPDRLDGAAGPARRRDRVMLLRPLAGEPIPVVVSEEPLGGPRMPRGRVVVARDIRERRAVDAALEATELRYRSLFWHNPGIAYELDPDGTIVHVNPVAETLLDAGPGELRGRTLAEVVSPEDLEHALEILAAVQEGESREYEIDLLTRRGERRTLRGVSIPIVADDRVAGIFGVGLDVTEEIGTKRQLEVQRRYFAELFEGSPEAIALINEDGVIRRVNSEFARLFGYSRDEAVGRNLDDLIVPEGDREEAARLGRLAADGRLLRVELVRRRKEGGLVDVSLLARRFQPPGEELQVYAIYRDVTEKKRTESRLREREEELRHAQRLEAVGRLAGGIAHDFNNLLTVINGHARFLLDELDPGARARPDLEEIERAGVRAASLTQQLLAFSRRQVMRAQPLDLNLVIRDMERMLHRLVGSHIRLRTTLRPGLPRVLADRAQVEQVVMNLVVNARDAMPDGGVLDLRTGAVHLQPDDPNLSSWDMEPGPYVHLAVEDTGEGIPPETLARVFDPFFTTKERGKGIGLGLATVFGIVKQSGGHVTVWSEPGQGARFEIYLPAAVDLADPADEVVATPDDATASPGGVVLVAEDEPSVRRLAARILMRRGFEVLEAPNGVEALELAASFDGRIDLLLTDLVMPEMGGRELARRIRALRPETAVLVMSGYEDEVATTGMGDDEFVKKPFTPAELAGRVSVLVGARRG
jgi:two-component system, cell cycle sensor histidine kinase and response regulator CckA